MRENTNKAYCTCGLAINEYMGLVGAGQTKGKALIQWVHAPCGKPTRTVWLSWLAPCVSCLALFSAPWSHVCKECHREEGRSGPFRGWGWGRKENERWHQKIIDEGRALRYALEVGRNTGGPVTPPKGHPE
jgi:hypothetical protein